MLMLPCLCCHLVDALREIASAMGSAYWKFDADSCSIEMVGLTQEPPAESERSIGCDCSFEDNTVCHVVRMYDFEISLFLFSKVLELSVFMILSLKFPHPVMQILKEISSFSFRPDEQCFYVLGLSSALVYLAHSHLNWPSYLFSEKCMTDLNKLIIVSLLK